MTTVVGIAPHALQALLRYAHRQRQTLQSLGRAGTACKSLLAAPPQCSDVCNLYFAAAGDPAAVWLLEAAPGGRYLLRAQVGVR